MWKRFKDQHPFAFEISQWLVLVLAVAALIKSW